MISITVDNNWSVIYTWKRMIMLTAGKVSTATSLLWYQLKILSLTKKVHTSEVGFNKKNTQRKTGPMIFVKSIIAKES